MHRLRSQFNELSSLFWIGLFRISDKDMAPVWAKEAVVPDFIPGTFQLIDINSQQAGVVPFAEKPVSGLCQGISVFTIEIIKNVISWKESGWINFHFGLES